MKYSAFIFIFFFSLLGFAQDSSDVKSETPKIVYKLQFGKTLSINDVSFQFVKVVSDSRCPKNVSCVWAGEVAILVNIIKEGGVIEQKELIFGSNKKEQNQFPNLFKSEAFNVSCYNVFPYPVEVKKIDMEAYYLQLEVQH